MGFIFIVCLTVPWTARRSNQSILKEINPEYSLEGLMLKLKLQYFCHLIWRTDSLERRPWHWERLRAGGEGGDREWDGWMASSPQRTWISANSGRQWRPGKPGMLQSMRLQSQTQLSDWTTTVGKISCASSGIFLKSFFHSSITVDETFECCPWSRIWKQPWEQGS